MPGNRCPSCNKFVGLENADPETDSLQAMCESRGNIRVEGDLRHARNCADCGETLKEIDEHVEEHISLDQFKGWDKLDAAQRKLIEDAMEAGELEVDVEEDGTSADESGGHRYKKNMIVCTADFTLEFEWKPGEPMPPIKFTHSGQFRMENQASSYNEM